MLGGTSLDVAWNLTLATNIISANVRRGDIEAIEAVPGVESVFVERRYSPDVISTGGEYDPDMAVSGQMTGAQEAWKTGYTGYGTRIAIIDTGLDTNHQSFDDEALLYSLGQQGLDTGVLMSRKDIQAVFDDLNAKAAGANITELYRDAKIPYGWCYVDKDADVTHDNDTQGEHGSHVGGIAAANSYVDTDDDGEFEEALDAVGMQGNAPDAQILVMKVFGNGGGAYDSDCVAAIEDAIVLGADSVNLSLGRAMPGFSNPTSADENDPYVKLLKVLNDTESVVIYSAGNAGAWADNSATGDLYNDGVNFSMGGESGSYTNAFTVASVDNDGVVSPTIAVGDKKFGFADPAGYDKPAFVTLDPDGEGTEYQYAMLAAFTGADGTVGGGNEETAAPKVAAALRAAGEDPSKWILVVRRGNGSFYLKGNAAAEAGFGAVIVANNQPGTINMGLDGYTGKIPMVSVAMTDGEILWDNGTAGDTENTYVTGTLTVNSKVSALLYETGYYSMSTFTSWGVTGALELKPEISAPGGNIWSVNGLPKSGKEYELMSGTSMAAPQVTGVAALVQQHIKESGYDEELNNRALSMALLMSTANPMKDAEGNYYSLLQQGAGMINAEAAVTSPAYITVDGRTDGKAKVELGDDPGRNGTYTVDFTVHNLTDEDLFYSFDADVFTQAIENGMMLKSTTPVNATVKFYVGGNEIANINVDSKYDFNDDGKVDETDADLLLDYVMGNVTELPKNGANTDVDGDKDTDTRDVHTLLALLKGYTTVPANGSVKVTAVISGFSVENETGGYVEAYISAEAKATEEGVIYPTLNLPVFGYYGSWTDPSMFEIGTADDWWEAYEENYEANKESKTPYTVAGRLPYTAHEIFYGIGNDGLTNYICQGTNTLLTNGATLGLNPGTLTYRYASIRNSGNGMAQITYKDENGNDVLLWRSEDRGPEYGIYYSSTYSLWLRPEMDGVSYYALYHSADIDWAAALANLPEDVDVDEVTVSVVCAPEYYAKYDYNWNDLTDGDPDNGELGEGAFLSTIIKIDLNPPVINSVEVDEKTEPGYPHVVVTATDDNMLYRIGLISDDGYGDLVYEFSPDISLDSTCVYNSDSQSWSYGRLMEAGKPNVPQTVTFDGIYGRYTAWETPNFGVHDHVWYPRNSALKSDVYQLVVEDLYGNITTQRVFFNMTEAEHATGVKIYQNGTEVTNDTLDLLRASTLQITALAQPVNLKDRSVKWSSKNEDIATVDENGVVTGVSRGKATIVATAATAGEEGEVSAEVTINVFTIPVTATGILGDVKGHAKKFTWDFWTGVLDYDTESEEDETIYPIALTRYENDNVAIVDSKGNAYILDPSGLGDPQASADAAYRGQVCDMSYSKQLGFGWTGNNYVMLGGDPLNPSYSGWNWSVAEYGSIFAMTFVDKEWSYTWSDGTTNSGHSIIYLLTDTGKFFMLLVYPDVDNGGYRCITFTWNNLNFGDIAYDGYFDGSQTQPYSNMVMGDDGALYISIKRNDTNEVYRMKFDLEIATSASLNNFTFTPMGDFGEGVWPALFLDVKGNGEDAEKSGNTVYYPTLGSVEPELMVSQQFTPEEVAAAGASEAETGTLNSIDVGETDTDTETDENGIVVDSNTNTVTVPVYANSTNGQFELSYDSNVLTLKDVTPSDALLTSVVKNSGTVKVGFADSSLYKGLVATVTFTYASGGDTKLTLAVTEDGAFKPATQTEYPLTLPWSYVDPGTPNVPSVPSTPSKPSQPEEPFRFADVPENSWYGDAVYSLYEMGLIEGVGEDSYAPTAEINRAAIATILYRLAGKPAAKSSVEFTDVASTDWYAEAVNWAADAGYMIGFGDGSFGAGKSITRQDMIVTLWRYAKANGYDVSVDGFVMPDFTDMDDVASYAVEAMRWAVKVGIINGVGDGSLDPTGTATRAQTATMIYRFVSLNASEAEQ